MNTIYYDNQSSIYMHENFYFYYSTETKLNFQNINDRIKQFDKYRPDFSQTNNKTKHITFDYIIITNS